MSILYLTLGLKNVMLVVVLYALLGFNLELESDATKVIVITTISVVVGSLTWCEALFSKWLIRKGNLW